MAEKIITSQDSGAEVSEIRVTVQGDACNVQVDGTAEDLYLGILAAVHEVAKELYALPADWKTGEELVHLMQEALKPTGKIWQFGEGGEDE